MQALKPKFLLHTAKYQLLAETHSWQMNGDWPRFHAIIRTYKLFISEYFHDTLHIAGYLFRHQFNPLINWKHLTVHIIHKWTHHIIPVVKAYGIQHQPISVDGADCDLQAVQSQSGYITSAVAHTHTSARHCAESSTGEYAE